MRHRRAERCLLRAEIALEAGLEGDARVALDEARALNPAAPDFETLRARIAERQAIVAAPSHRRAPSRMAGAATVILASVLAAFAFWPDSSGGMAPSTTAAPPPVASTGTSASATGAVAVPPVEAPAPLGEPESRPDAVTTTDPASNPVAELSASDLAAADLKTAPTTGETSPPKVPDPPAPAPDARDGRVVGDTTPAAAPNERPLPVVETVGPPVKAPQPTTSDAVDSRTLPVPANVDRLSSGLPSTAPPAASAPPAPAPEKPPPVEISEEPKVRALLARFEAAYSGLSASAAQAVWPSVDATKLARAFDSLESQQVSLGHCTISISGTVAQAGCNGTTSWTPKVGAGRRTVARHWSFDLESKNGLWRIVRAEAR